MTPHQQKRFTWIKKQDRIPDSEKARLIEKDNKHHYQTPQGHIYPSVTTMLSATMPEEKKKGLQDWRQRVGEQQAEKISKRATDIGTLLHNMAEEYLNNFEINHESNSKEDDEITITAINHFKRLQPFLDKINMVWETEVPLYHKDLMLSGTSDCIGEYDGILSVIDFKTSKKEKYEEWIEDYFLQATLYSMMYFHLTGIKISQIVILISGEEDGSATHYVKKIDDYVDSMFKRISQFNILEATRK
ncbi:MAG: exonuclease [Nitrosopumilus sp.]|nr:exonuclease [Nitrosopumilus sp.]